MPPFKIRSQFKPTGDQPQAIQALYDGVTQGLRDQTLMGVTGSGKTFTIANIIEKAQRPALVIAHNKTLAAQLCNEFRDFFPENAVEYFVSYYDYYQPEAYVPSSDTYIEKDSSINDEIDKLRHSATSALQERRDVIIVASVSCIYSMGDPEEYAGMSISLRPGMPYTREKLIIQLVDIQFERNDVQFIRGTFRVRGDVVEIFPTSYTDTAIRVEFFGDEIDRICEINSLTGKVLSVLSHIAVFPATHYTSSRENIERGLVDIERDMVSEAAAFAEQNKLIEEQRLTQRTKYDMEMMREIGYCSGIENYSRYFDGRSPGDPPFTLLDYFPKDFLVFIDESHRTVSQVRGMYAGDYSRKKMLVDYGFRLQSAFDNRPLKFDEFRARIGQTVYISATPGPYELEQSTRIVEQVIRPTGLCDPEIHIRPVGTQVDDLIGEIYKTTQKGYRTLVTTLTKKMAENLTDYLRDLDIRVQYLHSDVETLDRMKILRQLRLGEFDVLVGINLLREGLDLPEVGLVAILDADKEGFLRSESALIQTVGRAARNVDGYVVMYADVITDSMRRAIDETNRRRAIQSAYNEEHGITPQSIRRTVHELLEITAEAPDEPKVKPEDIQAETDVIKRLEKEMKQAAQDLDYERAAVLRDRLMELKALSWESAPAKGKKPSRRVK